MPETEPDDIIEDLFRESGNALRECAKQLLAMQNLIAKAASLLTQTELALMEEDGEQEDEAEHDLDIPAHPARNGRSGGGSSGRARGED